MTYLQTYLVGWVGQRALADLRIRIFTHLQSLPIGFYESRPAGVLISRMTNDVEALDSLVTDSVVTLFQSGLTLLGTIAILITLATQRTSHVLGHTSDVNQALTEGFRLAYYIGAGLCEADRHGLPEAFTRARYERLLAYKDTLNSAWRRLVRRSIVFAHRHSSG